MSDVAPPLATLASISGWRDAREVVVGLTINGVRQRVRLDKASLDALIHDLPIYRYLVVERPALLDMARAPAVTLHLNDAGGASSPSSGVAAGVGHGHA